MSQNPINPEIRALSEAATARADHIRQLIAEERGVETSASMPWMNVLLRATTEAGSPPERVMTDEEIRAAAHGDGIFAGPGNILGGSRVQQTVTAVRSARIPASRHARASRPARATPIRPYRIRR